MLATSVDMAAEQLLQSVDEASNCVVLHLNANKTNTLLRNVTYKTCVKTLEDTPLQNVTNLKYRGSIIVPDSVKEL